LWTYLIVISSANMTSFECVQVCCVYTGMTFEVKIEADSNDITEHPHDDKL